MNDSPHRDIIARLERWDWPPKTSVRAPRRGIMSALSRWAAAALLVAAAFLAGRRTVPAPDLTTFRAEPPRATAAELNRVAESLERSGREDRQMLLAVLNKLQNQHAADFLSLRRDLETVAATAEDRIERTHHNLLLLTSGNGTRVDH